MLQIKCQEKKIAYGMMIVNKFLKLGIKGQKDSLSYIFFLQDKGSGGASFAFLSTSGIFYNKKFKPIMHVRLAYLNGHPNKYLY